MLKTLFLFLTLSSTASMAENTVMEVISLNNRPASELQTLIRPLLERSERIIANGFNLIIKATPSRQKELKSLISQLDTRLATLAITVLQSRTKTAQGLNASANITLNTSIDKPADFSASIRGRFARTEGFENSDSRQEIKTLEGKPAFIKTGKNHPVTNISIHDSGFGHPVISSNTQFIEATTGFIVTPRLRKNRVIMDITPWSDKMTKTGSINTQETHTSIQVNLGQWIEIGGISEQHQIANTGTLSHRYSTQNNKLRILVKVEKL